MNQTRIQNRINRFRQLVVTFNARGWTDAANQAVAMISNLEAQLELSGG